MRRFAIHFMVIAAGCIAIQTGISYFTATHLGWTAGKGSIDWYGVGFNIVNGKSSAVIKLLPVRNTKPAASAIRFLSRPSHGLICGWGWFPNGTNYSHLIQLTGSSWLFILLLLVFPVWSYFRMRRSDLSDFVCKCGYPVLGNESGICSECGETIVKQKEPNRL